MVTMQQVFVANPKGGCGKTTISTQLAGYFANQGKRVLLLDHDAQKSSSDWLASRPESLANIDALAVSVNTPVTDRHAEWVVHDMPAAWSLEQGQDILHRDDKVLIPVLSSPNDIKACVRFVMSLYRSGVLESGVKVGLVANRARVNTRYYSILQEFLSRLNLPVIATLRDSQNYIRAMDTGLSIFDLPESGSRVDRAQWHDIIDWLTH